MFAQTRFSFGVNVGSNRGYYTQAPVYAAPIPPCPGPGYTWANGYWNPPGPAIANLNNGGPHGFAELLYTYSSGSENNGSAFAGINANTPWYNLTIGFAMLIGRFLMLLPLLAIAGSLAAKKQVPVSAGTFPTHGPLFVGLLVGVVVIVGALTYFPALSLGPIVEHLML